MAVRFTGDKPSPAFLEARAALAKVWETDRKGRADADVAYAYADVVHEDLMKEWMQRNNAKPYKGKVCIQKLLGKRCGQRSGNLDCHCEPPGSDHSSMFRKDDGSFIFVTQPYDLTNQELFDLVKFCEENEFEVNIDPKLSWHFPSKTLLIQIEKKK